VECGKENPMTTIFAHRGASGHAPENTLAAFDLAVRLGADGVEFDVQLSSDGIPVVIHDETLRRTTGHDGWVSDLTAAELGELDASMGNTSYPGQAVPTLTQVLDLLADTPMTINIEIKNSTVLYPGLDDKVLRLIDEYQLRDRVIISSFNHITLARIHAIDPGIPLGLVFEDVLYQPWRYAQKVGASAVHPGLPYLRAEPNVIDACHAAGLAVRVWTVDEPTYADLLLQAGVDGIFTNFPDRALEARARLA